jgi:hypothetical protein
MGYAKFLKWVGEQALKNKVLQPYLNKAWREAEKLGRPIIEKNFPGILKKAQDLTKQIRQKIKKDKTLDFNVPLRNKQSKEFIKEWNKNISPKQQEKIIENLEGIKIPKKPFQGFKPPIVPKQFNKFRPRVIQGGKSKKPIPAEDIIKKGDWDPSGFKSGGRIDKALPKKSRDI